MYLYIYIKQLQFHQTHLIKSATSTIHNTHKHSPKILKHNKQFKTQPRKRCKQQTHNNNKPIILIIIIIILIQTQHYMQ